MGSNLSFKQKILICVGAVLAAGIGPELVLARADKQLYEEKKNWHLQNG